MTIRLDELDSYSIDVLTEVGNIGAGNATTALSQMINKKIDMEVPSIDFVDVIKLPEVLGGLENIIVGILIEVKGDIEGIMMFIVDLKSAHNILKDLLNIEIDNEHYTEFSEMELSALNEIANIIIGAYLNSLSSLTGLKILESVPSISCDMAGAILSLPAIELSRLADQALLINSGFGGEMENIEGNFILIPNEDSYETILKSLGVF